MLLTIMLCNATDAPHESVRQNFNLSFFLGFIPCFEKSTCFLNKIFD